MVSAYIRRPGLAHCPAAKFCREAAHVASRQSAHWCSPCANRPGGPFTLPICVVYDTCSTRQSSRALSLNVETVGSVAEAYIWVAEDLRHGPTIRSTRWLPCIARKRAPRPPEQVRPSLYTVCALPCASASVYMHFLLRIYAWSRRFDRVSGREDVPISMILLPAPRGVQA
ncbi:hypothetical protein BD309DRAFT_439625 [Dichomitus squalens]|nr:hypothetical protein BD309DRAFT_439625 [Dichomitus squalens]